MYPQGTKRGTKRRGQQPVLAKWFAVPEESAEKEDSRRAHRNHQYRSGFRNRDDLKALYDNAFVGFIGDIKTKSFPS